MMRREAATPPQPIPRAPRIRSLIIPVTGKERRNRVARFLLVKTAKGEYNPFYPKDKIKIVILDDQEESE